MEIKTISYRRVNNLGNYSSEHLEMFAELNSNDDVDQCAAELKKRVETALGLNQPKPQPAPAPVPVSASYTNKDSEYDDRPF